MELGIEPVELLLLVAAIVAMVARRFHLPYTVGLTLAGLALSFVHIKLEIPLTKDLIFKAFLPPLIFEAAFHMNWRELRADFLPVSVLATLGVGLAAALTAAGLHFVAGWPWPSAALLGVLISATDPVSVIANFKEAGVKGRLHLLVEAESLFNDGTAAVLFGVALAAASGEAISVGGASVSFVITVAGGVLCGLLIAGVMMLLAGRTDDHLVELTFTSVAAYGSFLLAEHFHFSGVLATLAAGVLMGNTTALGAFTERGHQAVERFWEYAGFVVNSLIFLLIGIRLAHQNVLAVLGVAVFVIILVAIGRALAVYLCCALLSRSKYRVPMNYQHILFWGGLRGALALALSLGLPLDMPYRTEIVAVSFVVVAFSVIVQGLTMKPLLRHLGEIAPHGQKPQASTVEGELA